MPYFELILTLLTLLLGIGGTVGESREDGKFTKLGRWIVLLLCLSAGITFIIVLQAYYKDVESAKEETKKYIVLVNQIQRTMYPLEFSGAMLRFTYDLNKPCYEAICSNLVSRVPAASIKREVRSVPFKLAKILGKTSENICGYVTETNGVTTGFISDEHGELISLDSHLGELALDCADPLDAFIYAVINDSYDGALLCKDYTGDAVSKRFIYRSDPYLDAPRAVGLFLDFGPPSLRTTKTTYDPRKRSLQITITFQKLTAPSGNGQIVSMFDTQGMIVALQCASMNDDKKTSSVLNLPPSSVELLVPVGRFRKIKTSLSQSPDINIPTLISTPLSAAQAGVEGLHFAGD
jgi:hypothetical protein